MLLFLKRIRPFIFAGILTALLLCPALEAQTDWAVEGGMPSYGEFNSPPPGAMTNPQPYAIIPAAVPPAAPGLVPFPPMLPGQGGSAVDNDGNPLSGGPPAPVMVHCDGLIVELATTGGAFLSSFPAGGGPLLPGMISGVAYDNPADIIWLTDGMFCMGVGLPPAPGAIPPIIVPMFPLPLVGGVAASGLAWDPFTGTLWFCDPLGMVTNCLVGGGPLITFPASPPLAPVLMGITVNNTNGNIQVTDGAMVAEFMPGGGLVPPGAFYLSANPYPIPLWGAPVSGLGFSLNPQRYGMGFTMGPGPPPAIGSGGGNAWAGNPAFFLQQTGATPGAGAYLLYGFTPAIPGIPVKPTIPGATLWINPIFGILFLGPVPAGGPMVLPLPIPGPPNPVGAPVFVQFLNVISFGSPKVIELSDALSFTIGQI